MDARAVLGAAGALRSVLRILGGRGIAVSLGIALGVAYFVGYIGAGAGGVALALVGTFLLAHRRA